MTRREHRQVRRHKLEGAVSDVWQGYCEFVRSICIHSAIGCITSSGILVPPSISPANWQRASFVAVQVKRRQNPLAPGVNQFKRLEPTWGDSTKIIDIVNALLPVNSLAPTNAQTLISNLGGSLYGPPHCQKVRNACAHKNDQNLQDIKDLSVLYIAHPIAAPTDCLTWTDAVTGKPAFISWLEDMRSIAINAIM